MAEPQDTQEGALPDGLDDRIAALEQYLATLEHVTPAFIHYAGGTVIHIRHMGSFALATNSVSRAGAAVIALVILGAVFVCIRRYLHAR
ncbi:MAG TPA: hypothetical protein VIS99_01440 [Terrimicrobiaceae bacterium]